MADAATLQVEIDALKKKIADGVVDGVAKEQTAAQIASLESQLAALTP